MKLNKRNETIIIYNILECNKFLHHIFCTVLKDMNKNMNKNVLLSIIIVTKYF